MSNSILSCKIALIILLGTAAPTYAQSVGSLVETCEQAAENPEMDGVEEALSKLSSTLYVRSSDFVNRAEACLTSALGSKMTYIYGKGFLTKSEFAALEQQKNAKAKQRRAYEAKLAARQCELIDQYTKLRASVAELKATKRARLSNVVLVTVEQCDAWLDNDKRAALTNPVCSDLFLEIGLPEDRNVASGLSLTATRAALDEVLGQIEIIREHQQLPEDYTQDQLAQSLEGLRATKQELGCD